MATFIEGNRHLHKEPRDRPEIGRIRPQTQEYDGQTFACRDPSMVDEEASKIFRCTVLALGCAQVGLKLWGEGLRGADFLQRLVSQSTIQNITDVVETIDADNDNDLDLESLLDIPRFSSTIRIERRYTVNEGLNTLLSLWFLSPLDGLSIVICKRLSEVVPCLIIPFEEATRYVVLVPEPSDGSAQPSFIWSSEMADIPVLQPFASSLPPTITSNSLRSHLDTLDKQESALFVANSLYLNLPHDDAAPASNSVPSSLPPPPPPSNVKQSREMNNSDPAHSQHTDITSTLTIHPVYPDWLPPRPTKQKERCTISIHDLEDKISRPLRNEDNLDSSPYPSTDSLLKSLCLMRSGSPSWQGVDITISPSTAAGPSRLGSPESRVLSIDAQSFEASEEPSRLEHSPHSTLVGDGWLNTLVQQLQEEEELAAVTGNHIPISHDNAWMVTIQKQRRVEQSTAGNRLSTSSLSMDPDYQLAVQFQEVERMVHDRLPPSFVPPTRPEPPLSELQSDTFTCGICVETLQSDVKTSLVVCGHSYCKECLTSFVRSKIEDGRFPIFCPECLIDRTVRNKCHISREVIDGLDLSEREMQRIEDLEVLSHSVILQCHRCNHRMDMPRDDYSDKKVISCTSSECAYHWCKNCNKGLSNPQEKHKCKNENIERLMRRKGWKYCPGCRTPVQKESGCNHMTCGAPGCNVHFCYKCGVSIVDTTHGGDVGLTVTEHYANSKCRLFDRRFLSCTIM